jgi:hypothetical protein
MLQGFPRAIFSLPPKPLEPSAGDAGVARRMARIHVHEMGLQQTEVVPHIQSRSTTSQD